MELMRLVVTGPVGAGKSTFIRTVSEIEVVDTDRRATDETKALKQKTTVALDFGKLHFGNNMAVHLYGTPGQARFDFMWDILIRRAHAYVLLVPANRPREFRSARRIMTFMEQRVMIPTLVGLTHVDCPDAWTRNNVAIALGLQERQRMPIVEVNPHESASVAATLVALIEHFFRSSAQLDKAAAAGKN